MCERVVDSNLVATHAHFPNAMGRDNHPLPHLAGLVERYGPIPHNAQHPFPPAPDPRPTPFPPAAHYAVAFITEKPTDEQIIEFCRVVSQRNVTIQFHPCLREIPEYTAVFWSDRREDCIAAAQAIDSEIGPRQVNGVVVPPRDVAKIRPVSPHDEIYCIKIELDGVPGVPGALVTFIRLYFTTFDHVHFILYPGAADNQGNVNYDAVCVGLVGEKRSVSNARINLEDAGLVHGMAVTVGRSRIPGFVAMSTQ